MTNGYLIYGAGVVGALAMSFVDAWLGMKIVRHSDGGGYDSGSAYSYVPTLKPEYSITLDDELSWLYQRHTPRQRVFQLVVQTALGPVTLAFQACFLVLMLLWPRFSWWLKNGKIDEQVDPSLYA